MRALVLFGFLCFSGCGLLNAFGFPPAGEGEGEGEGEGGICFENTEFVGDLFSGGVVVHNGDTASNCLTNLAGSDCASAEFPAAQYELLEVFIGEPQRVRVRADWNGFDGYLMVYRNFSFSPFDPSQGCVAVNDDEGGTASSQVEFDADVEGLQIIATTFGGGSGGSYVLTVTGFPDGIP